MVRPFFVKDRLFDEDFRWVGRGWRFGNRIAHRSVPLDGVGPFLLWLPIYPPLIEI